MDGGGGGNSNSSRFYTFSWRRENGISSYLWGHRYHLYIPYPYIKKVVSCWRVPLLNGHHLHTHPHEPPVQLIYRRCARSGERPYLNGLPS
jgi:hypothetical protein